MSVVTDSQMLVCPLVIVVLIVVILLTVFVLLREEVAIRLLAFARFSHLRAVSWRGWLRWFRTVGGIGGQVRVIEACLLSAFLDTWFAPLCQGNTAHVE